jgi:hypothetical protein
MARKRPAKPISKGLARVCSASLNLQLPQSRSSVPVVVGKSRYTMRMDYLSGFYV